MRRQNFQLKYIFILSALISNGLKSENVFANTNQSIVNKKNIILKPKKKSTEITVLPGDISEKNEKELIGLIKGFQAIIKTPGQGKNRNTYIISQMASYLALARIYRIKKDPTEVDKKNEALALERVVKFKDYFSKSKSAGKEEKAKALFYGGQALIYQNDYNQAIQSFQQSIQLDPNSIYVGTMSLFIAETWFDEEKYNEAIVQYNEHFKKLNEIEKALAIYKIAWCLLNLNRYQEAEKNFVLLIGKAWAGHFSADSLKDLAYTGTLFRSEQELIEQSYKLFKDPEIQLEYLMQGFNFYLAQSSSQKRPLLFAELMRRVKDPSKKLNLLLIDFHGVQKQYASHEAFRAFLSIESFMKAEKISVESEAFKSNKDQIETELMYLAKNYSDTFTGKIKSPENFELDELIRTLRYILNFHLIYFPNSKEREVSYKSLITLCSKQKDYICIYNLSNKILSEPFSTEFKEQILQEKINAIEVLLPNNQKLKKEQIESIEKYVIENPNTNKWLILAKRLTVLLNEEKQYALSLPWLVKIHEKENTSESLYRLQYAKFESGDFKGVVENKYILPKDENGLKVQKLISESYIRLAEVSINKDDFSNYEKNISSFLESNTDQEKTSAAKLDYLDRLLERKEIEKVYAELKKMNFDSRFNKTFGKTTLRLQSVLMKNMDWLKVESLYVDHGTSLLSPDQKNQYLFSIFAQNRNLSEVEFKMLLSLNPSERDYYLGLIVVTKPDLYIEIYKKSKFESNKEKSFLLLAHQIKQGKSEPDLDPNDELILQEIIPVRMKNKNPKSIAYLDKIVIPTPAFSPKKFENYLKDAIYRVRRSRKMIAEDLKNTNFQRQTLILEKASTVEKSLADSIVNSPVPPDLDEAMKSEYASKLSELSSEFTSQSSEYDKIRTNIEKEMTNKISQNARLMNLDLWPWPKNSKIEPVEKAIGSRGFILSFLILDQLRNNKEITTEEYFEAKSRMNLLVISNEFAVEYLFSELSQFDQTSLLKKWEQIGAETENVK